MCEEGEQGKEILLLAPARPAPTQEVRVQHSHFAYIVCTLVSNLERTFTISPDSKPFDHRLRIVHFDIVEDEDGAAINRIMELAYEGGRHVELSGVTYEEIESCRIDFEEEEEYWRRVCVDGLIVKVERGGWMKVSLGKRYKEVLQIGGVGWEKAVEPLKLGEVDQ